MLERLKKELKSRYSIERELGRGGMATVYLAEDLRHGRRIALKVLHPDLSSALGPDRFLRETKLAARPNHPHKGFGHWQWIDHDSDFDSLRKDPGFEKILAPGRTGV